MGTSICFKCPYDHFGILGDTKSTFKLCNELVKENNNKRNYNSSHGIGKEVTHQCQVISDNHPHPDEKCC